ncbi:hypothetical protein PPSIR1_20459 [Plesiocystis pacifica SIR-1]|uniref:Integral membrane protein CcmA involved in cell shape determination n=1 Tax=Plesiocystis pacifica SIR-1 TaxID=391625 RepID=A6G268_9BACT|nr:polymer-forming cytoskeletal protein [Plesiocystis pacifica]EDM80037.1 hypothetical protein PPSIR1_20459 [Plesiocystis pacifica SIR-1]
MSDEVTTILGESSSFEGKLTFEGTVRIDGAFRGEIHTEGTLIVGEQAKVEARVQAGTVVVRGEIRGDVSASESLAIMAPARLRGNVSTPSLTVERGAFFEGSCSMSSEAEAAPSEA